jgi:Ca2+-binding EF-hand superfamily protein
MAAIPAMALAQPAADKAAEPDKPVTRLAISDKLDSDYADLDANKDGKVTSEEINARLHKSGEAKLAEYKKEREAAFAKMDVNGDGSISKVEFEEKAPLPKIKDVDTKPFMDRFDKNKDGTISRDEFRAPTLANFDQMDLNKDGTVSVAEQNGPVKKTTVKDTPPVGR